VGQKLQESRFTGTIGAHDTDSGSQQDVEADGLLEDVVAGLDLVRESDVLEIDQRDLVLRGSGVDAFRDGKGDGGKVNFDCRATNF